MNQVVVSRLAELAPLISQEAKLAEMHASKAVMHAITVGRMLTEAKTLLDHGQFIPWIAENTTVSERDAQRYMNLYSYLR